jgi:putative transposase
MRQDMPDPRPDPDVPFRKRCKRYNVPGQAHYLTFSCFQRRPFLSRDRSRLWLVEAIDRARTEHAFELWAYVIMPEHAHVIIHPKRENYDVSAFFSTVKLIVSRQAVPFVKLHAPAFLEQMADRQPTGRTSYRFWQRGGGYDRNLWSDAEVWEKIDYLHANPVKRELCARSEDWAWSSAADYLGLRRGLLALDRGSLPPRR